MISGGREGSQISSLEPMTWADLGAGDGTFTRALAQLLVAGSVVHAIDLDDVAMSEIPTERDGVTIVTHRTDFVRQPWPLRERLDGILMANSLHYVREQEAFIRESSAHLGANGRFVIVEYDFDRPNKWVPYPVSRRRLTTLFTAAGFAPPTWLGSRPSVYQRGEMYAALIRRSSGTDHQAGTGFK
jgi:SAM-dependent methyltransferase